jgi:hypothetical protein
MGTIVGLHGNGRTGKDSIADLFVERLGFVKLSFAAPLYEEVADAYGVDEEQLLDHNWKTFPQKELRADRSGNEDFIKVVSAAGYFADESISSRTVLQLWANDYKKKMYGEDYYAAMMIGTMRRIGDKDIIFSDLRHSIEAAVGNWQVNKGRYSTFKVIELLRHGTVNTGHSSDNGLAKFMIDASVRNNGTLDECYTEVLNAIKYGQEVRTHG